MLHASANIPIHNSIVKSSFVNLMRPSFKKQLYRNQNIENWHKGACLEREEKLTV